MADHFPGASPPHRRSSIRRLRATVSTGRQRTVGVADASSGLDREAPTVRTPADRRLLLSSSRKKMPSPTLRAKGREVLLPCRRRFPWLPKPTRSGPEAAARHQRPLNRRGRGLREPAAEIGVDRQMNKRIVLALTISERGEWKAPVGNALLAANFGIRDAGPGRLRCWPAGDEWSGSVAPPASGSATRISPAPSTGRMASRASSPATCASAGKELCGSLEIETPSGKRERACLPRPHPLRSRPHAWSHNADSPAPS